MYNVNPRIYKQTVARKQVSVFLPQGLLVERYSYIYKRRETKLVGVPIKLAASEPQRVKESWNTLHQESQICVCGNGISGKKTSLGAIRKTLE